MTTLLEIKVGLNTYYGESHILRDVDLVKASEMVCLIGRNGVSKTTLLKSLIGLLRPRSGTRFFWKVQVWSVRRRIGPFWDRLRPQGREIIPQLTVEENLMLGMEALPGSLARHRRIDPVVYELFPILRVHSPQGATSVVVSNSSWRLQALLGKPRLLLLDEPTEGIQPNIVQDIEAAVRRIIADTGIGVLLVEQHLHFVRQADRYYAMQRGGIVTSASVNSASRWWISSSAS